MVLVLVWLNRDSGECGIAACRLQLVAASGALLLAQLFPTTTLTLTLPGGDRGRDLSSQASRLFGASQASHDSRCKNMFDEAPNNCVWLVLGFWRI